MSEDTIPPLIDIELSVAVDKAEVSVTLQPMGKVLDHTYKNGRIYFKIDRVDIHSVAEISRN